MVFPRKIRVTDDRIERCPDIVRHILQKGISGYAGSLRRHFIHTETYGDIFYVFIDDSTERLKNRMSELEKTPYRSQKSAGQRYSGTTAPRRRPRSI